MSQVYLGPLAAAIGQARRTKEIARNAEQEVPAEALAQHSQALSRVEEQCRAAQAYLGEEPLTQEGITHEYYTGLYRSLMRLVSRTNGNYFSKLDDRMEPKRLFDGSGGMRIYYEDPNHREVFRSVLTELGFHSDQNMFTEEQQTFLQKFGTPEGYKQTADRIIELQDKYAKKHYEPQVTDPEPLQTLSEADEVLESASRVRSKQ